MEQDSIDRIRSATFPLGRRGYEKRDVDRFLDRLADWLETGGADQTRSELVRRELDRVGQQTGKILVDAHDAAEHLRVELEEHAREQMTTARREAEEVRTAADRHAAEVRSQADAYAARVRAEADARLTADAEPTAGFGDSGVG